VIKAQIKGLDRLERFVDRLLFKVADTRTLMEKLGARFVSTTVDRINRGIEPPNAPLTRAWKKGSNTPLRDTGRLMSSITYKAGKDLVIWGSNLLYAGIHQLGGTIKPVNAKKLAIPAGWDTRRLMRKYGETPEKCIEGLKKAGWKIWFRDRSIMGVPPRKRKKAEPVVLFIRKKKVEIPARPFLRFEEPEKRAFEEVFKKWLSQ
jgi:phage gpG-like protein